MKIYNKIVRDKILEIIEKEGRVYSSKILNDKEAAEMLALKIKEEADEFIAAPSKEEMADFLEVIYSIASKYGWDLNEIEKIRLDKIKNAAVLKKIFF
ncbi:MAG TPA: nucleoside triphosphate pyrophosphohydrolase [Candidatus Wallbacteria bacterium]|nr:nucleoside triphosphate pyrophosphohydrolase [Candidatus Wallbacteria bacterium]